MVEHLSCAVVLNCSGRLPLHSWATWRLLAACAVHGGPDPAMGIGTDLDTAAHTQGGLGSPGGGGINNKGPSTLGLHYSSLRACVAPSLWPLSVKHGVSRIFGFPPISTVTQRV